MAMIELGSGEVARLAGISFRRLDFWIREGLITPAKGTTGTGDSRRYSFADLLRVRVIARLRREKVSLQMIRRAVAILEERWQVADPLLSGALLAVDGELYLAESPETLWHVLSGQGAVKSLLLIDVGALAQDTEEKVRMLQLAA